MPFSPSKITLTIFMFIMKTVNEQNTKQASNVNTTYLCRLDKYLCV